MLKQGLVDKRSKFEGMDNLWIDGFLLGLLSGMVITLLYVWHVRHKLRKKKESELWPHKPNTFVKKGEYYYRAEKTDCGLVVDENQKLITIPQDSTVYEG